MSTGNGSIFNNHNLAVFYSSLLVFFASSVKAAISSRHEKNVGENENCFVAMTVPQPQPALICS